MNGEPMNPKDDVLGLSEAYVHGLLESEERAYIEAQAVVSPVWREALREARARAEVMRSVPASEPSEELLARSFALAGRLGRRAWTTQRVFTRVIPGVFAAAAALLLLVQVYFQNVRAHGYDLMVLGQTELSADAQGSIRVRLLNGESHEPVIGAPVEVSLAATDGRVARLASFTTDARGTGAPSYRLPDWNEGEYQIRVTAAGRERVERKVTLRRPTRLMLSTDKPVYQPGQAIHARALALRRADGKPESGREAVFTIADPKGTVIFKQRAVTSAFGIVAADCPLADEILHGAYTLRCVVEGTESSRTVEVKPYALPKFRMELSVDEPYLRPGQVFRAKVFAEYFFGRPIAGGRAEVTLAGGDAGSGERSTVVLDASGRGEAAFRVPDRLLGGERDGGDARITLTAAVTDEGGQSETRSMSRIVAARELRIEVLPESGVLMPGLANRVYVLVTTPDGQPAPRARLAISGVDHELTTSELGVAEFDFTPTPAQCAKSEGVTLTVTATDAASRSSSRTVSLASRARSGDFLFRTDAAVYAGGGTMTVSAFGTMESVEPVFVDVLKDGQTVLTRVMQIDKGRGELAMDLPPEISGTLVLEAYRFGPEGVAARRTRTVVVERPNELKVAVRTDKDEYKPGERARISMEVTGADGRAAPGAVSIAAVDEAVFSVLDQRPGTEGVMLGLEEEMLKPVYTVYPWMPRRAGSGSAAELELDRALFSATAAERNLDRRSVFKRLVDEGYISEEGLEVLESPRAERMIRDLEASGSITPDAAAILRGAGVAGTHTLSCSTWPEKVIRAERQRRDGNDFVSAGWVVWGLAAGLVVFIAICVFARPALVSVVVVILCVLLLIGILLPALGKARQSARQLKDITMMRGLGMALDANGAKAAPGASGGEIAGPRVRQWFPETLLWRPEVVTDDSGRATVDVDVADSITTWRVFGGAVTREGRLGSFDSRLRVFQPFFVDINAPSTLTREDQVSIPVVVYNYLDREETVRLSVKPREWFDVLGDGELTVKLPARGVGSVALRIRAKRAGVQEFEIAARVQGTEGPSDAIRRTIEVRPGGRPVEKVVSGSLGSPLQTTIDVPAETIDGSGCLLVKVYPSPLSQLVEGLEGVFAAPHGCFEQTSSTTYPNVMALRYLRQAGKSAPTVEATARQYIHLGYQRLVSFEVNGGGFDWFGRPPANRLLTAYGLMEFVDMAKVHDVDPALIARTRGWLMRERLPDGSWSAEGHGLENGLGSGSRIGADVLTTAYVAWAVFGVGQPGLEAAPTRAWLESIQPKDESDPYLMALVAHAVAATGGEAQPWVRRLEGLRQTSPDGKWCWWSRSGSGRTAFYGRGRSGDIEATALAALALMQHRGDPTIARGALAWLTAQRDVRGTWGTTQATVLALKALVAAADAPLGEPGDRTVVVQIDDQQARRLEISADQAEVFQQIDLSRFVTPGSHRVSIRQERGPSAQAQVAFRYAVPGEAPAAGATESPLSVEVRYDRDALRVGEELSATVRVRTTGSADLPMVMLDLPIPPGFEPRRSDFDAMVQAGTIARYEVTPRSVVVYLTRLGAGDGLMLSYAMQATMPVEARVEGASAYEYYNPEARAVSPERMIRVQPVGD